MSSGETLTDAGTSPETATEERPSAPLVDVNTPPVGGVSREVLAQQMAKILDACTDLSTVYSLNWPKEALATRVHEVAPLVGELVRDWTLEICFLLDQHQVLRYGELKRRLPGISTRTLAAKLQRLQQFGFVQRTFLHRIPPHVEYRLTERGRATVRLFVPLLIHVEPSRP